MIKSINKGLIHNSSIKSSRREFLTFLGVGSLTSLATPVIGSVTHNADDLAVKKEFDEDSDYLFAPGLIYLSTATLGPCPKKVVEESMKAWYALEANPHLMAYNKDKLLQLAEKVRQQAAELLGCSTEEMAITRSTTDGMNAVAQGLQLTNGQRVLTTDQEHKGGQICWEYLERRNGIKIDTIKIPPGENNKVKIVEYFRNAIASNTRVISVSHVTTSTGLRMPIEEIAALARENGIFCVVDGAQAVGGIEVNVKSLGCHAYATSGHKWLMGPKGTGLLYLAKGTEEVVKPIQFEAGRKYYSGSSGVGNLPGVVGLGVALDFLKTNHIRLVEQHNLALRNRIYEGLKKFSKITILSAPPGALASPLITFLLPPEKDSQVFAKMLRETYNIMLKIFPKQRFNGIRLSPHIFNTERDIDRFLSVLNDELR